MFKVTLFTSPVWLPLSSSVVTLDEILSFFFYICHATQRFLFLGSTQLFLHSYPERLKFMFEAVSDYHISWDSSVGIPTGVGWMTVKSGFNSRQGQGIFFYLTSGRVWSPPSLLQNGRSSVSPGVSRQGREADHSTPSNAEVKNGGAIPPFPNMSLWHGAQLIKSRVTLPLSLRWSQTLQLLNKSLYCLQFILWRCQYPRLHSVEW
jgi:hypothetical protein